MSPSLHSQNTDPPTDPSYFRLGWDPKRQVCKCVQMILFLPPLLLSVSLSLSFCFESKPTLCTERAELADSKLETERLVMIRGSNWVMGSKDAHLFPGLLIQTESKKEAQRNGGGWHTHLQNIGLRETIDQSYNEFPEKCAEKMCAHHCTDFIQRRTTGELGTSDAKINPQIAGCRMSQKYHPP